MEGKPMVRLKTDAEFVEELRIDVARLRAELAGVQAGYRALDANWAAIHNMAMNAIRDAMGNPDATVPEICEAIRSGRPRP